MRDESVSVLDHFRELGYVTTKTGTRISTTPMQGISFFREFYFVRLAFSQCIFRYKCIAKGNKFCVSVKVTPNW